VAHRADHYVVPHVGQRVAALARYSGALLILWAGRQGSRVPDKPSFFVQLQQRHVFRVAAMYALTSWLLLQLGSVIFEPLGFPVWSQRALIIVIAAGFPIALVLAWIYDVTPEGVVRVDATPTGGLSRARKIDLVIIVILFAALVVTLVWRPEPAPGPAVAQDSSIAILPFVAMSEDGALRHLGEGLSEQITNELVGHNQLRVAARTSAFEQSGKDVLAIARGLGVSYVLEGSVRPNGATVRVTAQLVRGQDGLHLWSDTQDFAGADPAAWDQAASLVAAIVSSYLLTLEPSLQQARMRTANAKAYEHFAAARRLRWQMHSSGTETPKPHDRMLDEIDRAISIDPDFFLAHVERAGLFFDKLGRGAACGNRCIDEARRSVDRALELQPDDPEALRLLSQIQLTDELDPAAAETTLERVRRSDPASRWLNGVIAALAQFRGDAQEAREYFFRQLEITPDRTTTRAMYAVALVGIGDLEGAERELKSVRRLASRGDAWGIAGLHIHLLIRLGKIDEAKAEFAPIWAAHRFTNPERFLQVLGLLGYEREALELTEKLSQEPGVDPFWVFLGYYGLGRYDDALVWLRRVVDGRHLIVSTLRLPNQFPGLQEHAGYAELLSYLDSIQRSH
jgi:adenylate cyclase